MAVAINSVQRYTPSSGGTVTVLDSNENIIVFLDQSALLTSLTIDWPVSPYNGQMVTLLSLSSISGITNSGAVFNTAPASIPANQSISYIYDLAEQQWNFNGVSTSLPAPTTSSLGGIEAASGATSNQFMTYVDTSGVQHTAQPAFSNLSGSASQSQLPAMLYASGVYASKPASPATGQMYFTTDLGSAGILLIYNGSKWMPVGGVACLYNDGAYHSGAGNSTETNYAAYKIPAGLVSANGGIEIYAMGRFSGTNGTKTLVWRLSTTSGDTSAGYMVVDSSSGSASTLQENAVKMILNNGSQDSQNTSSTGLLSYGANTSAGMITTAVINMASAWYINLNLIGNSADTVGYQGVRIVWFEN